jgi:hypothetical protein
MMPMASTLVAPDLFDTANAGRNAKQEVNIGAAPI